MKHVSLFIAAAFVCTMFTQCKKSSNSTTAADTPFVTATIGSLHFSAKTNTYANGTFLSSDTLGGFRGTDTTLGIAIAVDLANYKGPGTYSFSWPNDAVIDSINSTHSNFAAYGTLTITDTTTYIKGTFSFTCNDSTKVTDGKFLLQKL